MGVRRLHLGSGRAVPGRPVGYPDHQRQHNALPNPAPRHCFSPARPSKAAQSTARSRWASSRWPPARSRRSGWTAHRRWRSWLEPCPTNPIQTDSSAASSPAPVSSTWNDNGTRVSTFAKIAAKARAHAAGNPYAVFRAPLTVDEILASTSVCAPLTRLMSCPPTCGAAAAVVCTPEFATSHGLSSAVTIRAQAMTTDTPHSYASGDRRDLVGAGMTREAARQVYEQSGVERREIAVVELHDCFASNELITYEALGLTPEGTGEAFVDDAENTYGGRVVTNPSGGLLSKGHPLGATGLAQCAELVWQLRGTAGERQVEGARLALQHNIGLGGPPSSHCTSERRAPDETPRPHGHRHGGRARHRPRDSPGAGTRSAHASSSTTSTPSPPSRPSTPSAPAEVSPSLTLVRSRTPRRPAASSTRRWRTSAGSTSSSTTPGTRGTR